MNKFKLSLLSFGFKLKTKIKKIDKEHYKDIMKVFKDEYNEISTRHPLAKGIMEFHRMWLIMGLALYKALHNKFQSQEDRIEIIHNILWKGLVENICRFRAFFVRRSKDPFNLFLKRMGPYNESFFPCPPWEKVRVEIENGIGWHQKKCPMFDFFKKEGVVELTKAFCDLDKRSAELLPDHIELKRDKILRLGDSYCDFLYYRK